MILDTTFLIDLMDQLPEAISKIQELEERREKLLVSSISIFELWTGIAQSKYPEKEKQKVSRILGSQLFVDFDQVSAEEAGKINGTFCKIGSIIDPEDCMIAGIARTHNEVVLTRNLKHFGNIEGFSLETY